MLMWVKCNGALIDPAYSARNVHTLVPLCYSVAKES